MHGLAVRVMILAMPPFASCAAAAKVEYNRDVRPILSDNCFLCHGPDKNTRKAKLRLDICEDAVAPEAVVAGKPEANKLVKRLFSTDADDLMPPPDSRMHRTDRQSELAKGILA